MVQDLRGNCRRDRVRHFPLPSQAMRDQATAGPVLRFLGRYMDLNEVAFGLTAAGRPLLVLPSANRHREFPAAIRNGGQALGMLRRTL
jgi:hypothetical protein